MEIIYKPYIDPEFESLIERIHPPRICIDNDACEDCTLVKVDSANKHGILLEMVQVLTDLDLVISKSYISSDGGWFMDVFHVTDQLGHKITDESLILYIQKALCPSRRELRPDHASTEQTVLEMTATDRPGLMSEMSAVLLELGCNVTSAAAWTHNTRVACILNVEDGFKGGPIRDPIRLTHVEEQLWNVVEAHHGKAGERSSVRLMAPVTGQTHKERRLHQLMYADKDYEWYHGCEHKEKSCDVSTHVSIESCKEKEYSVVNVRSRDRPKLLFDTVCALTDMQYVVFHAAVSSKAFMADQEYFIRHKDGCTLDTESERHKLSQCLIAAIERRVSHGLRLEISTPNRMGLLSDITRVLRENALSISMAEVGTRGERAVGSFYIKDASGHDHVNPNIVEAIKKESGGSVLAVQKSPEGAPPQAASSSRTSRSMTKSGTEDRPRFSLGSLLWSQLERFSGNFGPIRS